MEQSVDANLAIDPGKIRAILQKFGAVRTVCAPQFLDKLVGCIYANISSLHYRQFESETGIKLKAQVWKEITDELSRRVPEVRSI